MNDRNETSSPQASAAKNIARSTPLRILIVDDNVDLVRMVGAFLELRGHIVLTATDAEKALKLVYEHRPEVAIVDIGMPGMSGLEIAQAVRSQPWGSDVFLIAATGLEREGNQKRIEAAGFDLHLTKPISMFKLEGSLLLAQNRII